MIETIKRHVFLLALAAGVVVGSLAVIILVYFVYVGPNNKVRRMITTTRGRAMAIQSGPLFSEDLVKQMDGQVERRKKQHDELLGYIRARGSQRKPLVEGLFPTSTDINLRHLFKSEYDVALDRLMKRLGAGTPVAPTGAGGRRGEAAKADLEAAMEEFRKFTLFAHPKESFDRPEWVGRQEAPPLEVLREAQEDIWLMQDLVEIIASMNDEILKAKNAEPRIADAPIKELTGIHIGGEHAVLSGSKMAGMSGRYRPTSEPGSRGGAGGRAPTLSGRFSKDGFYRVLPWRLAVVAEARYAGELIRRLKGRESFISVEAWRMAPITDASFERARAGLAALSREDYGNQGVVRLEVIGESLVFQLEGGRITTLTDATKKTQKESAGEPGQ